MDEHLSQAQLRQRINDMMQYVRSGTRYQHYKGGVYTVVQLALIEATNEPAVVYRADYGEHIVFIRPLTDWLEQVEVDGQLVPRFVPLAS